ncbi:hydrogenase maturation nickel metallochaperone HypA [Mesorhizobium sp. ArgA1]
MHELALCESIRSVIESEARKQGFSVVKRVHLEIGVLSGVEADALRFGFDVAMAGSIAQHARLEIDEPLGEAWCMPCSASVEITARYDPCPACGSHQLQVTGGTDMKILELEVL